MTRYQKIKIVAKALSESVTKGAATDSTFCTMEVRKDKIILRPDNKETFYHCEEVTGLCCALGLACYVTINTLGGTPQIEAHIY